MTALRLAQKSSPLGARALGLFMLLSSLTAMGCTQEENLILLEVSSPEDVGDLEITVLPLDGTGRPSTRVESIRQTAAQLRESPLRIAMRLGERREVMVMLRARRLADEGNLVAQRCFVAAGTVRDNVWLVPLPRTEDGDLDGFPRRSSLTCARPNAERDRGVPCEASDPMICTGTGRVDCDDDNASIHPGAIDTCEDGIDQNCDGEDPSCEDHDGDGFSACRTGEDPILHGCDCNDADPNTYPGASDSCLDPADTDCDGRNDLCDEDGDGYPAASDGAPGVYTDCDDTNADVHPNVSLTDYYGLADGDRLARGFPARPPTTFAVDRCTVGSDGTIHGDGLDQDCNGFVDDGPGCTDTNDRDRDGYPACTGLPDGRCDTDDCDPGVNPGRTEICGNGIDEDGVGGDALCDEDDRDGDGQRSLAAGGRDCNDEDPTVYDGAPENCLTPESESCRENLACDAYGARDDDGDGYLAGLPPGVPGDCEDRVEFTVGTFTSCDPDPCRAPATCRVDEESGTATCVYRGADIHPFAEEDPCDGIDNNCNGIIDELPPRATDGTRPWDGCVRTGGGSTPVYYNVDATYSEYCGGCGVTTGPTEDCCGSAPVAINLLTSCGSCGHECGPNTVCEITIPDETGLNPTYGCVCDTSVSEWSDCDGNPTNGCEVNLDTSAAHCGSCGHACGPHEICAGGMCVCEPSYLDCTSAAGCETNSATDANSCGACGVRCGPGETCSGGRCVCGGSSAAGGPACTGSTNACCNNTCVNTDTNTTHCGGCNNGCGPSETCGGGRCRCGGTTAPSAGVEACAGTANECCGGSCADTRSTVAHCSACGFDCGGRVAHAGALCAASTCGYGSCDRGWLDCDMNRTNGCETAANTLSNCGTCGQTCGGVLHAAKACNVTSLTCDYTGSCESGWFDCDSNRANGCETPNTTANCGGCGRTCAAVQHATATCSGAGVCGYSACDSGWLDCDGNPLNGCETPITTSNCGSCGASCTPGHASGATCSTGSCNFGSCESGWLDCNSSRADGCETSGTTLTNCGTCGTTCSPGHASGATCSTGSCNFGSCESGWLDCNSSRADGCETNGATLMNCGSCGNACSPAHASGATCSSGSCNYGSCDGGWLDCNGNRADGCETNGATLMNCGSCGNACSPAHASGATCSSGSCSYGSCDGGWLDCNSDPADGCETNGTTATNCGSCGNACPTGQTCTGGACS